MGKVIVLTLRFRHSRGLRGQSAELAQSEGALETRIQCAAFAGVVAGSAEAAAVIGKQPSSAKPSGDAHLDVEGQCVEIAWVWLGERMKVGAVRTLGGVKTPSGTTT
jgi:hypothetical protein